MFLLAFLLLNCAMSYAGDPAPVPQLTEKETKAVDRFIKSQERIRSQKYVSRNAQEYRDSRQYISGKLDGNNVVVVRYTLEESNTWTLYIAVFRRPSMQEIAYARVGGKEYREVELSGISNEGIELKVLYYSNSDGLCCPSVPGTSVYYIAEKSLIEGRMRVDCTQWKAPERP